MVARYLTTMNEHIPDKFSRYRARRKAAGLREMRMWVHDVNASGFQESLDDQIARINDSEDEREVMIFCETAAEEMWRSPD